MEYTNRKALEVLAETVSDETWDDLTPNEKITLILENIDDNRCVLKLKYCYEAVEKALEIYKPNPEVKSIALGKRDPKTMTKEELHAFLVFEGMFQTKWLMSDRVIEAWKSPVIDKMHLVDETLLFSFSIERIADGLTHQYEGYISFDSFILCRSGDDRYSIEHLSLKAINYLIEKGFDLPFKSFTEKPEI